MAISHYVPLRSQHQSPFGRQRHRNFSLACAQAALFEINLFSADKVMCQVLTLGMLADTVSCTLRTTPHKGTL